MQQVCEEGGLVIPGSVPGFVSLAVAVLDTMRKNNAYTKSRAKMQADLKQMSAAQRGLYDAANSGDGKTKGFT